MATKVIVGLFCLVFLCASSFADIPRFYGDEVVVTALRVPRLRSSIPWNTKLITREDIEASPSLKLGDIMRSVSGLSVKSNGGLASQISARFRGSNSQQVLVLLNGSRINSPTLGTFDLGDILLTDVDRIEIVKAPLSAVYGADAVGGVVNIITRQSCEKADVSTSVNYGEYSTLDYAVSGSGPFYAFSAAFLSSAGFRENSDYMGQDFSGRLYGDLGRAKVEAGVKKYAAQKGSPGSLDFLTPLARQHDTNLFYDLVYRAEAAGLKAALSQNAQDQRYENPSWGLLSTHHTLSTNFDVQKTLRLGAFNTLLLGLEVRNDNSQSTNSGRQAMENKAVYVQDEFEIGPGAKFVLGGREDINSAFGTHFSPRLGCVFALLRDTVLKASWGTSFKSPTLNDLYWSRTTEPGWPTGVITTEGNPGLLPENAQSIDLTLERRIDARTTARLSFYLTEIRDMIRWTNTATSTIDAFWTPLNVSNADIQGAEFEYEKDIHDRLKGFVNFTYQTARDRSSGNFLDYAPQITYNAGLRYRGLAGVTSNFVVRHVGERYADLANLTRLPAYTVADASFSRELGRFTLKLDIENLFSESYAETYGFMDVYPMPGRRYNIGVRMDI